jgi:hypothetical protein
MKVVMTSYYTGPKGKPELKPGDVAEFDDTEGSRIISVGGARAQNDEEIAAEAKTAADQAAADAAAAKAAKNPT